MASPLQFILELVDRVSAPAKNMAKAVESYDNAVAAAGANTDAHTKNMTSSWEHFMHEVEKSNERTKKKLVDGLSEKFAIFEIAKTGVEMLAEMAEKAVDLGVEFAKDAVHAAEFERTSRIGFTALVGSAEEAERVMKGAKAFALEAGTPINETMQAYKNLIMGGIKPLNVPVVLQAAADISNIRGEGAQGMMSYAQAFADIQSRGQLAGRALMQFKGVLNMDALAKNLGVAKGGFEALQKTLEASPVSASKGIHAILKTIAGQEGGTLGQVTKDIGKGWEGSIEKIKSSWDLLLEGFEKTGAFDKLLNLINRIGDAFDTRTESGRRMAAIFDKAFDSVGKVFDQLSKPGVMEGFAKSLQSIADSLAKMLGTTSKIAAMSDGHAYSAAAPAKKLFDWKQWTGAFKNMSWDAHSTFQRMGLESSEGMAEGLRSGSAEKAMGETAAGVVKQSRETLDIHSPSKVMRQIGRFAADGFALGLDDGGFGDAIKMRMPDGRQTERSRSAAGGAVTLHIEQHFHVSGTGIDEHELAQHLQELSQGGVQSAIEQMGLSMGNVTRQ